MTTARFDPNRLSFEDCVERIRRATERTRPKIDGQIITSRDEVVAELRKTLAVDNVPAGFQKWQLPIYLDGPSHLFVTIAEPGAKSPVHAHEGGDGFRFIAGGSIIYEGRELTAGDWMFIPAGASYSFEAGPYGATICYCYRC